MNGQIGDQNKWVMTHVSELQSSIPELSEIQGKGYWWVQQINS